MDEKAITRAAQAAVNDLQLDCKIESVSKHSRQNKWCIQFTGQYGQFCDEFHNEAGKENSARVIREKIKSFLFKVRKPGRDRRAKSSFASETSNQASSLLDTPVEFVGDALDRTTGIIGSILNQFSNLTGTALESGAAVSDDLLAIAPTTMTQR